MRRFQGRDLSADDAAAPGRTPQYRVGAVTMETVKSLFQLVIGLGICAAGLVILWLDVTSTKTVGST